MPENLIEIPNLVKLADPNICDWCKKTTVIYRLHNVASFGEMCESCLGEMVWRMLAEQPAPAPGQTMYLTKLSIGSWSGKVQDTRVSDEVKRNAGVSNNAGVFIKTLITPETLAPLTFFAAKARVAHNQLTMPWDDNGQRLLPSNLLTQYCETMDKFCEQRVDARTEFLSQYDAFVQERRTALGTMFDESDYPTADALKERFTMSYSILPSDKTSHFDRDATLDAALQDAIKEKIESTLG